LLISTGLHGIFDDSREAIGFWMRDHDSRPVRVFVTCEGLWQLDPFQVRDLDSAFKLFDEFRGHIEGVASNRQANGLPYDGECEGRSMMILRGDDIAPLKVSGPAP
jgi:hypothetical protein